MKYVFLLLMAACTNTVYVDKEGKPVGHCYRPLRYGTQLICTGYHPSNEYHAAVLDHCTNDGPLDGSAYYEHIYEATMVVEVACK